MYGAEWRHQYDLERDKFEGALAAIDTPHNEKRDAAVTQQHFAKDTDINEIVKRFGIHDGSIPLPDLFNNPRLFGDFSEATDLRTTLDLARDAQEKFDLLPANIRKRFNHDPVALHEFISDPANDDEAIRLGLLHKETPPLPELGTKDRPLFTTPITPDKPAV